MLKDLLEKRARLIQEMRGLTENPEGQGDLSEAQARRFDELKGELDSAEKAISRQQLIDEAERRMAGGQQIAGSGDNRLDAELRQFSLLKAIGGAAGLQGVDWGRERELQAELAKRSGKKPQGVLVPLEVFERPVEQRVLTTTNPAAGPGSNIISTDYMGSQFIDILRNTLVTKRMGARVLNGLQGNVDIPRRKASGTAGWVAENGALSAADIQFDKVQLTPKHAGALTELSRNMILQTSPDVETLVREDFALILAEAVDGVAIQGGGSNEPTGILETSGIGDVAMGTNGLALSDGDDLVDLIGAVADENAEQGSLAFLTNTSVRSALMKLKDGDGRYYGLDYLFQKFPRYFSNLVPSDLDKGTSTGVCSAMIFGNWNDLLLGYWSAFDILVNPYESTAYSKGNVQVRAMLTCDVAVRHAESFAAIQDILTA